MEFDGPDQMQTNISHHTSSDIENPCTPLVHSMEEELERLSPLSSDCGIYRVRERLRHGHERVYTPHIVSIGPLHHGKETLKDMEEHKMWYLKAFIGRTKESMRFYVELVKQKEARLRRCYSEKIQCSSEEFIKIILVDAAFIIEVLLKFYFKELNGENDHIFNKPWMKRDIWRDMIMLENQLPFFILEDLYDASKNIVQPERRPSILKLSHYFFKNQVINLGGIEDQKLEEIRSSKIEHFVDLLRQLYMPSKKLDKRQFERETVPSLTELHQAGVKFKVGSSRNLFDIHFEKGILEIPRFNVGPVSELIIRNIVAFEQCSA
ncbi:hypothetical protein CJ030_MR5G025022 [Morella rubra]|uniref:Uncharacterized protein n=1 Tax=Morella rubra TaxID=262757 RepID=A0A6A1VHQ1_9ROSI|nr:hypothetical protein CJ030_MR5G025022 [Morella rubra]